MIFVRWIFLLLLALPGVAFAAGLGDPIGPVFLGQALSIRIPVLGTEVSALRDECIRVTPLATETGDRSLDSLSIKVDQGTVVLRTREVVTQPILSFRINIDCGFNVGRNYQLLPSMPVSRPPPASVASPAAAPTPPAIAVPKPDGTGFTVPSTTTLRLISRERYPHDGNVRAAFIRRVAAANPDIFASIEGSFDQRLPTGTRLRMPDGLPPIPAKNTTEPKPARVTPPAKPAAADHGKGRLIIGATAIPVRSTEELEQDIDRLIGIMNEQMLIQVSMAERLAKLEGEIAQAKQNAAHQKDMNQRLDSEVKELRAEQRWNSYIQIILAILLGGFAVASILLWREQVRTKERARMDMSFPAPAAAPQATPAAKQELLSIFDELLPRK